MAFQAKQRIIPAHSDAIVSNANKTSSTSLNLDSDTTRLRIESIFNQFLHDARRSFDHLARRDLIGDMIGKKEDAIHFLKRFNALTL
jgi:hypothetical protein